MDDLFAIRINAAWESKSMKMDWLGLEVLLRDILSSGLEASEKVELAKEAIAAFTKRG